MSDDVTDIKLFKAQVTAELNRLEAQSSAKDVAGKAIGKNGLMYITIIVVIGVVSSLFLDSEKIAAVMGLLGASLTALISMLNGIAGTVEKEEKPEFEVIKELISKLDKLHRQEQPMRDFSNAPKDQADGLRRLFANDLPGSSNDTELLLSGNVQTAGGRVLTVVANAPTLTQARDLVYRNVAYVNFNGMHYRKDIALPPSPGAGGDGRPALPPAR